MERDGTLVLHPADQVRGYTEYCWRFHSTVQEQHADVRGCVLFTRDYFVARYADPPDKQEKATQTVLEQAEVLSAEWATAG